MDLLNLCLTSTCFQYSTTNSYTEQLWVRRFPLLLPKSLCKTSRNKPWQVTNEQYHSGYATLTILSQLYTKTKLTIFTNISTDKTPTFSLPRRSRIMVRFLFLTAWSAVTTTDYKRRFTENPPTLTDSLTNHLTTLRHTIRTLTRRALLVCNSQDSLANEHKYLDNVFSKNNYNCDFLTRNTYRTEPNATNTSLTPTITVTIPYIKGTSEIIARILQPYNIRVAHRPINTLRKLLTNVKDKDQPRDRQGAVYKIKCCDCQATYIGETGRND